MAGSDDDELLMAAERLRQLKIEEEKLSRKEKLKEIAEETQRLQDSIKGKKKKFKFKFKHLFIKITLQYIELQCEFKKILCQKTK